MSELRRRAEEKLKKSGPPAVPIKKADREHLIHEMEVYQIELEMQNEDLKRLRSESEALAAKYLNIYEFAPVGYFTLNPDGVILQANLTGARLIGVPRAMLIGKRLAGYISSGTVATFREFYARPFRTEKQENCEVEILSVGKPSSLVQMEGVLSVDARECRLVIIDITERKKAEEELKRRTALLEEANRERESFSYSVSHDLRAPLRAIDGYARMLLRKHGQEFDEDSMYKFNVIRSSAQKMGQLIDDILTLSRLGRKQLSISKIDMKVLVEDVWKELQSIYQDRNINLTINGMPSGYGDRLQIKQAYANLLANAVKFSKFQNPTFIEVGGYEDGNEDIYFVKDNGVGFNMAYYNKLFGIFQRLHKEDSFEGTGIGLAIVKSIINRHDDRVWAEGKEGEGATFYFSLPFSHTHTHTMTRSFKRKPIQFALQTKYL